MTVPGWTIEVNSREGIPKASVTRWDQVPFAASKSWVVVQLVRGLDPGQHIIEKIGHQQ